MSLNVQLENVDPRTAALLVVDVQKIFAAEDSALGDRGADVSRAARTVPSVTEAVSLARRESIPVVFTRSYRREDGLDSHRQVFDVVPEIHRGNEPICRAGSEGVEYVDGLEPRPDEYEVRKQRYDAFHNTRLDSYLRAEDVETVLACGFTSNVCVEGTARGAHERGYNVVVLEDCCNAYTEADHRSAMRNIDLVLGTTATLEELRSLFN